MPLEMVCNFRKCRRSLSNQAWVTTCSHAFCIEHGKREFRRDSDNGLACPACGNILRDKFDVIQAELNPCETFKSIVLAGMAPDTIMEIAMRGMSFWSYQVEQETLYQENLAKHAREKLECLEDVQSLNTQKLKAELETCKKKIASLQQDYNKKRKQTEELSAALEDKSRKVQKLSLQLDSYKRKGLRIPDNFDTIDRCDNDISRLVTKRTNSEAFVFRPAKEGNSSRNILSPKTPMFDFRNPKKHSNFKFGPLSS